MQTVEAEMGTQGPGFNTWGPSGANRGRDPVIGRELRKQGSVAQRDGLYTEPWPVFLRPGVCTRVGESSVRGAGVLRNGGGGSRNQGGGDKSQALLNSCMCLWGEGGHWKGQESNAVERVHPEKWEERRHHQNLWSVRDLV